MYRLEFASAAAAASHSLVGLQLDIFGSTQIHTSVGNHARIPLFVSADTKTTLEDCSIQIYSNKRSSRYIDYKLFNNVTNVLLDFATDAIYVDIIMEYHPYKKV
jgi:hypothetical protein